MTKLRNLTALLLAGVLTLLLLTACSGGGGSSGPEAQAEAEVMRAIRGNPSTASLTYDDEMRDIAKANLDAELKGNIGGYGVYHKVNIDSKKSTLTLIAQYDYKGTKLEELIKYITSDSNASSLNYNQAGRWTKVGVAAKIHQGANLHRHHSAGEEDLTCPFFPINADHPPVGG